jgi:hypothetical protein
MEASQVQNVLNFSICGSVGDQLFYVYFDSNVVGEIYLQILQAFVVPILDDMSLAQLLNT